MRKTPPQGMFPKFPSPLSARVHACVPSTRVKGDEKMAYLSVLR